MKSKIKVLYNEKGIIILAIDHKYICCYKI